MSKKGIFVFLALICLVVSFVYRNKYYWSYPPVADTFDEYASSWLGLSLLRSGVPTSWSFLTVYKGAIVKDSKLDLVGTKISVNNIVPTLENYGSFPKPISLTKEISLEGYKSHFDIVSPYLEHPPLGGIIVGMPAYLGGIREFSEVTLSLIRKPFVLYGTFSTLLVIILSYLWYGKKVAVVSGLIYATVPTVIFGSRLALPENVLTLMLLLEVVLLEYYRRTKKNYLVVMALMISFAAPLVKLFGLSAALIGIGYFIWIIRNKRMALYFLGAGVASLVIYTAYGFFYDKNTFVAAAIYNGTRFFAGPTLLLTKILIPRVTKIFLDGWIFFGWMALFILAFAKENKHKALMIPVFSYLIGLMFFGGEDFGWYRLPLYPFLLIAAGYLIVEIIFKPDFFTGILFLFTAFSTSLFWGIGIYNWVPYIFQYRLFILVVIGVMSISFITRTRKVQFIQSGMLLTLFLVSVFLNTRIINNQQEVWKYMGDSTSLIIGRQ
ncbi:MAG TPA: hypothetical protein VF185_04445 [Patescibacteria group bacterium]